MNCRLLYLLLCICISVSTKTTELYWVNTPVLGIYKLPNIHSPFESQELYGHTIVGEISVDGAWLAVNLPDGTNGYCLKKHLLSRSSFSDPSRICRIKSITGCVYPTPTVVNQTIIRLPYNAYISLIKEEDNGWIQIQLLNGKYGWMLCQDIEPITILNMKEALKRAEMFLGIPYIWGGTSSFGFDCSGLVQTLAYQIGYTEMRRNSQEQANDPQMEAVEKEDIKEGDLVYYGKNKITHTGICISPGKLLHATIIDHKPQVVISPIDHPSLTFQCARRLPLTSRLQ